MTTTKKMLVAFDPKRPNALSRDFVIPVCEEGSTCFLGIKSGNFHDYALMVFIGKNIKTNDVFAKLVESGRKIADVDKTMDELNAYFEMLKEFRIGDVLCIEPKDESYVKFTLKDSGIKATGSYKK